MNKRESIHNWLCNDKESYFNFLNELKEDKFNNHLSATKRTKSESDVHNNRSIKQKPNHPTNDSTNKYKTKVSKNSPANRTVHLVTDTETTPVNKKKRRRRYHKGRTTKGIINQSDLVVNLSSYQLTADEIKVLSKGLKFIPTPRNINKTEVSADIKEFGRRMRLNEFFHDREAVSSDSEQSDHNNSYDEHSFHKPSNFTPKSGREPALDLYLKYLERNIMHAKPQPCKSNISKTEREAIVSLRKNKNIVIFEADKGGAVVVMNKTDYITEARNHLNSVDADGNRIYKELTFDCTDKIMRDVKNAVEKASLHNIIDDELAELLIVDNSKPGNIYFLPKIHKNITPPPGRPICNTINTPTMNLSRWVDIQLQPLVKNLPSYLKDDNHFLRKIDEINKNHTLPRDALLVTWDVRSLYTNIPHKEGLEALKKTLHNEKIPRKKANTILEFSELVLNSNQFKFLGQHYLQMSGTAMGTKMAPSYANLFMGVLEKQMLSSYKHKPLVYFRYIDDIFMIWTDGEDSLNDFLAHCNNQNKNI